MPQPSFASFLMEMALDISEEIHDVLKTSPPFQWDFFGVLPGDYGEDMKSVLNSTSYLVTYVSFLCWFVGSVRKRFETATGTHLAKNEKYLATALSLISANGVFWPLTLITTYYLTCSYYPWTTSAYVLWLYMKNRIFWPLTVFSRHERSDEDLEGFVFASESVESSIGESETIRGLSSGTEIRSSTLMRESVEVAHRRSSTAVRAPSVLFQDRVEGDRLVRSSRQSGETLSGRQETATFFNQSLGARQSDEKTTTKHKEISASGSQKSIYEAIRDAKSPPVDASISKAQRTDPGDVRSSDSKLLSTKVPGDKTDEEIEKSRSSGTRPEDSPSDPLMDRSSIDESSLGEHERLDVSFTRPSLDLDEIPWGTAPPNGDGPTKPTTSAKKVVKSKNKMGYCGRCWRKEGLPFKPGFSHLRETLTTRSGLVYGPPHRFLKLDEFIEEYGISKHKKSSK